MDDGLVSFCAGDDSTSNAEQKLPLTSISFELDSPASSEDSNMRPSPSMPPPSILDLPKEILSMIFSHVRGVELSSGSRLSQGIPSRWHDINSIKNCRLVCGLFCASSSRFLLPHMNITLTAASLSRLDEVSRHPTISTGTTSVCIGLDFYAATEFRSFLRTALKDLRVYIEVVEDILRGDRSDWNVEPPRRSGEKVVAFVQRSRRLVESCGRYGEEDSDYEADEQTLLDVAAIVPIHQEYMRRVEEPVSCSRNGFVPAVAKAIARMPNATMLFITSHAERIDFINFIEFDPFDEEFDPAWTNNEHRLVRALMLRTFHWLEHKRHVPAYLPQQLPLEICRAGTSLHHLHLMLGEASADPSLGGSDTQPATHADLGPAITAVANNLTTLSYHTSSETAVAIDAANRNLGYLEILMTGEKLRWVNLYFTHSTPFHMPLSKVSIESLLSLKPPPKLEFLDMTSCSFHLNSLRRFLDRSDPKTLALQLRNSRLLSGSWAAVLDLLRDKADRWRSSIDIPHGAELDSMTMHEKLNIMYGLVHQKKLLSIDMQSPPSSGLRNPFLPP